MTRFSDTTNVEVYMKFDNGDWERYVGSIYRNRLNILSRRLPSILEKTEMSDLVEIAFRDGCDNLKRDLFVTEGCPFLR